MTAMIQPCLAAECNMAKKVIINIGRQFGSGGKSTAMELGKKLGIPVYDNELLTRAAEESGLSAGLFSRKDESRSSLLQGLSSVINGSNEDVMLFQLQSQTIRNIAESGSAIIVGRCSDYILRDMDCTLDVFITASMESRKARIIDRCGVDPAKVESYIEKKDRARESYYNHYTFGNWGVASNYDLCIDSSKIGIEQTADMIIEYARKAGLLDE